MRTSDDQPGSQDPPALLNVQTDSEIYLLDHVDSRAIRWTLDSSDRRRDDRGWMPVVQVHTCRIGEPLVLIIRGSDGLVRPVQSSGTVQAIDVLIEGGPASSGENRPDPLRRLTPLERWRVTTDHVSKLTPASAGVWLVTTRRSRHIWNLDQRQYLRMPGSGSKRFDLDGTRLAITRIERWPTVGESFLVWFDDPEYPAAIEQYRLSSIVGSIVRLVQGS